MNFIKKHINLLIALVAIIVVGVGTFILSDYAKDKYFREISYEKYEKLSSSKKEYIVYIGSKKDTNNLSLAKDFANDNGLTFKFLNTDNLSDGQVKKIYNDGTIKNEIVLLSNKTIKDIYSSSFKSEEVLDFFVNNKILSRGLVDINIATYMDMVSSEDSYAIFIGRDTCHYCQLFHPIADQVAKSYNVPIYYLNTDNFSNDDWTTFTASESFYSEEEWGTPLTIFLQKGKIVDYLNGYVESDKLVSFLTKNGMVK